MDSLRELFVEQLQDAYHAEKQLMKALPKLAKEASSTGLQNAFQSHLEQTRGQIERLEGIFENLEEDPQGKPCKGMAGVIAEGKEAIDEIKDDDVKDAALIASAQKIEHYEIALYGTLKTFASLLDEQDAVELLDRTLEEEKEADRRLTELSEEVNARAEGEGVIEVARQPMRRSSGRSSSQGQHQRQAKGSSRRKR